MSSGGGDGGGGASGGPASGNGTASGGASGGAASGGYVPGPAAGTITPGQWNVLLSDYLYIIVASISVIIMAWRFTTWLHRYVRHVSSLNNETQRYFAKPNEAYARFKKHILYAPLFSKRHNREFQLSQAINVGTLPTRFQFVFLVGYFATNVVFCVVNIDWSGKQSAVLAALRNRTGILSVVNMVPLFVMAGRNNPLIKLLGISFDTFNLLHRWFGRIVVLEAVVHTLAHMISAASKGSWDKVFSDIFNSPFLFWGFIGTACFVAITFQAASVSRHAFYETFKLVHIVLAAAAVAGVYMHLDIAHIKQLPYVYTVIALWIFDRGARLIRLGWNNMGSGGTTSLVEALPGGACRVTVSMARPWTFKPGQHAYLYFPGTSYWQSHPFSVAWSEEADKLEDKLPMDRQDVLSYKKTTMSFVIRGRSGFTGTLYNKAAACTEGKMVTKCFVEGPYGGVHNMDSYGTVMLFAGGVGITHAVPYVRHLVIGFNNGSVAARKIVLVWIIQSPEHLEWIRPWMTEILALEGRRDCLRIMLFVSRPRSTKEIHSPSATVQMFPGRPNIETLLATEMENQVGCVGVSVCGPGALSDSVRVAVRAKQMHGEIEFIDEAFSW